MTIKPEYREGCLRLSFQGELDHHSAEKALREAEGIIDRYLPKNCILDLSGLSFMDSSGIAVILRIHRAHGGKQAAACWWTGPQTKPGGCWDAAG